MKKSFFNAILILLLGVFVPSTVAHTKPEFDIDIPNLDCVAEAVYFEARGEPLEGWAAVSEVIHNRATTDNIDYCQVVNKKRVVTTDEGTHTVYQFSYHMYPKNIKNKELYDKIYRYVALHLHDVITSNKRVLDKNVKHYDGKDRTPYWAKTMTVDKTIGGHTFYKEI